MAGAITQDPTVAFLIMLAAGILLVVAIIVVIALEVMGEHTENLRSRDHHA